MYLSADELRNVQSRRLRSVVETAYGKVPYYRALFDRAGVRPGDIRDVSDIARIPITTKTDLQERPPGDVLAAGTAPERCVAKHTSGSTGRPLTFFFSERERDFQSLLNLRIFFAGGFRLTDRTAYLINPHRFPGGWIWFQHLGILRRYYLSVFDDADVHREAILRIRPDIIYGYPSNLTLLALAFRDRGTDGYRPKAVFSSAESLEENPRALIASVLSTDVLDILGLVETGDIAWECPSHEGYHLNCDAVLMEFLDENQRPVPPGRPGRMICTSLYSHTMPLIRYDAGDICVPSDRSCSCGRTLPLIESIRGRANDFIVLPGGKIIASCFLVIIMQGFHEVSQYRILQEDTESLRIQIVKGRDYNSRTVPRIEEQILKVTGPGLRIRVEILEKLERDKSGKIRTVMSRVIPDFQSRLAVPETAGPAERRT